MPIYREVDKDFFKKWSQDMAYILGFLFADGNIVRTKRNTNFFSIYSADRKLLQHMKKIMQSEHKVAKRNTRSGFVYRIQIGSREMCEDLFRVGLTPNKSRRMKVPNIPKSYTGDFIRGYFDGDGNVWSGYVNKHRKKPTRVIQVAFTSASEQFLKDLSILIKNQGYQIRGGSLYKIKDKNCSRLMLNTTDSLKLHGIMYNSTCNLFLNRKKVVFERYMQMRP